MGGTSGVGIAAARKGATEADWVSGIPQHTIQLSNQRRRFGKIRLDP